MMFTSIDMPSPSSMFSAYASMAASIMLFRSMANQLIPQPVRGYLFNCFRYFIKPRSSSLTLIIEENSSGVISRNQVFDAAEDYLSTRVSPNNERLKITKNPKDKKLTIRLEKGEKIVDSFDGIELHWKLGCSGTENNINGTNSYGSRTEKRYFELSFHKKHKDIVLGKYLPSMIEKAKQMKNEERALKMHTLNTSYGHTGVRWDSINLEHPSTFETLALEPEVKKSVMEDLNRFVRRKEFYKRVGRAWKRGYLLYGPPGTGKSSLIAAMANYLKFDIYDLQLANIVRDSDLRRLLLMTANRSILVIEDIDCSVDLPDRKHGKGGLPKQADVQLTLSGLLNFIDGLWSSCGDERIIVFTTNHKERLDPALLRPGRMDMHIHMSYCTYHGFKILASNYLGININDSDGHVDDPRFREIEGLIEETQITPAQVAEELMKSEDADVAIEGFVKQLKRKKMESDVCSDGSHKAKNNNNEEEANNNNNKRQKRVCVCDIDDDIFI